MVVFKYLGNNYIVMIILDYTILIFFFFPRRFNTIGLDYVYVYYYSMIRWYFVDEEKKIWV